MALADIDGNGTLDLYVANYAATKIEDRPNARFSAIPPPVVRTNPSTAKPGAAIFSTQSEIRSETRCLATFPAFLRNRYPTF
jgi:hypothetical protein